MTVNEAAEYVRVHPATVRRWIHGGQLPAAKVGSGFRIEVADLRRMTQPQHQPMASRSQAIESLKKVRAMLAEEAKKGKGSTTEEIDEIIKEARRGRENAILGYSH